MKHKLYSVLYTMLCVLSNLSAIAQVSNFSLGSKELKYSGKKNDLFFKAAVGKVSFHSKIGGISFEQVATPDNSIGEQKISLEYVPLNKDANRLQLKIGNSVDSVYFPNIPDWQLIPIVNYANDTNNAVFTLLPEITDTNQIYNYRYHPAFKDQLLGLRMFQADLLFARSGGPDLADVPKDSETKTLLIADSEKKFKLDTDNIYVYSDLIDELHYSCPSYSSYILTDWAKEVLFGVADGNFYISGEPYYLFTKNTEDKSKPVYLIASSMQNFLSFTLDPNYTTVRDILKKEDLSFDEYDVLSYSLLELSKSQKGAIKYWFEEKYYDIVYAYNLNDSISAIDNFRKEVNFFNNGLQFIDDDEDFQFLSRLDTDEVYSWTFSDVDRAIENLNYKYRGPFSTMRDYSLFYPTSSKIELLLCGSQNMESLNKKIFDFNPIVFNSCIVTMRYAALFRYIKENNPDGWKAFVEQLNQMKGKYILPTANNSVLNSGIITPDQIDYKDEW